MVQHAPHSWFKGPHLGGVVVSQRKTNGCVRTFAPTNDAARAAWDSLKGHPLDVLVEHSKFAGYTLRRSPRGREFCLNMFNLAFPREDDVSGYYQVLPSVQNGVRWALEVFANAGLAIEPPAWAPDFGEARKEWSGVVEWLGTVPSARIPTYTPDRAIEALRRSQLPVPDDLVAEAESWRAAGRAPR